MTGDGFRHALGLHSGLDDLVGQIEPLVRAGAERGDRVAVDVLPPTRDALHDLLRELGDVLLLDPRSGQGRAGPPRSGQAVAAHRARTLDGMAAAGTGAVTAITEHDGTAEGYLTELETAVGRAMAQLPVRLTCFLPADRGHEPVRAAHPLLLVDGVLRANPDHVPGRAVPVTAASPPALRPPDRAVDVTDLQVAREVVERALREARCTGPCLDDALVAVNEVATNAVQHGLGPVRIDLWTEEDHCVLEVHDHGVLDDPLPGLCPPGPGQRRGWGLWVARQACDDLHVWADGAGTHVRLLVEADGPPGPSHRG